MFQAMVYGTGIILALPFQLPFSILYCGCELFHFPLVNDTVLWNFKIKLFFIAPYSP